MAKNNKKKPAYLRVRPKCDACGGALEIEEYGIYFKEETIVIQTECIVCGEMNAFMVDLTDLIDLEAEFWMAYYKKLPPPKEGSNEKPKD